MSDSKSFDRMVNLMAKADKLNKEVREMIKLMAKANKVNKEIRELKPAAVRELRVMGYSADSICKMLGMGKVTVLAIIHGKKKKVSR